MVIRRDSTVQVLFCAFHAAQIITSNFTVIPCVSIMESEPYKFVSLGNQRLPITDERVPLWLFQAASSIISLLIFSRASAIMNIRIFILGRKKNINSKKSLGNLAVEEIPNSTYIFQFSFMAVFNVIGNFCFGRL